MTLNRSLFIVLLIISIDELVYSQNLLHETLWHEQAQAGVHLRHPASSNSRSVSAFVNSRSSAQPIAASQSNGLMIMPANNQYEVNNFHSMNHISPSGMGISSVIDASGNFASSLPTANLQVASKQVASRLQHRESSGNNNSQQLDNQMHGIVDGIRQTLSASDENPFYHSSKSILEKDLNWLSIRSKSEPNPALNQEYQSVGSQDQQEVSSFRSTTSTTDQSNSIAQIDGSAAGLQQTSGDYQQTVGGGGGAAVGLSQPAVSNVSSSLPSLSTHSAVELQNHVIYEGPATAPPVDDYYFSSSEKLPNHERASNIWWALGSGQEYERASNLTIDDYLDYCSKSPLLDSAKQRSLCRTHPKVMQIVARGLKMAIDECQSRFTSSRWNCSLVLQNSIDSDGQTPQVFGDVMKHPNRERSFLNAIIAAGLAHAMTKACSQGELPGECSCDKRIRSKNSRGKIEWVACSDDIDFGARFSRDFTDNTDYTEPDTTSMINTHNYEVGRRVFKSSTDITCTCQDSLCQIKRCWKHLGPFADIGDELARRYESATHVHPSNKDPHKLRPVRRGVRKPKRKDLVYIDESPDYCSANTRLGILGTQNRRCNSTSLGSDSCSLLCCGRGYQVVVEEIEEDCNCKFVWCCQLKCDKCKRQITNDLCN